MKQLLEFLPIVLFFVVYQMDGETVTVGSYEHTIDGIFTATAVLIAATALQVLVTFLINRSIDKRSLWMLVAVSVFGGATLLFRNELFIQWKPTIFNWGLAVVFMGFHLFSERSLLERALGNQIRLPKPVWGRLNLMWITNFLIVGGLNLFVAYRYSEATWVSYKLYSAIGFTLLLTILTAIIIMPHARESSPATSKQEGG
jgi:intracellular septation protein